MKKKLIYRLKNSVIIRIVLVVLLFICICFILSLIILPKDGNIKIEGTFKSLSLTHFKGQVGISCNRISLNNGAVLYNNFPLQCYFNNKLIYLEPTELEIIYKSLDPLDNELVFMGPTNINFDIYTKNLQDEIICEKLNLIRTLKIKSVEFIPVYELEMKGEELHFWARASVNSSNLSINLPSGTMINIKKDGKKIPLSPRTLRICPIKESHVISFIGKFNELSLRKSINDFAQKGLIIDKILLNGQADSFRLKSDFNTTINFIQTGNPQKFEMPLTEISGKCEENRNGIEIQVKYTRDNDDENNYIGISGELSKLTFDKRDIILKSFWQWVANNYYIIFTGLISALITILISLTTSIKSQK